MSGARLRMARSVDRLLGLVEVGLLAVALNHLVAPVTNRWLVGLQAVSRWALAPAHPLLLLAVARGRPPAVLAGLAGYQLGLVASSRGARGRDEPPAGGAPVRLVSANLLVSNTRGREAGARLLSEPVDVLALQELTPDLLATLQEDGILDRLPHALTVPDVGYHGAGLFSRWPLVDADVVEVDDTPFPVATVVSPAGRFTVVVVHARNPGAPGRLAAWRRQLAMLSELAAGTDEPVVLVGDYNATADHRDFRRLLGGGLRDAWDVAGRGSGASWPVRPGPVPPLMRLDHALVGPGFAVRAVAVSDTPGSDHRHLRLELSVLAS